MEEIIGENEKIVNELRDRIEYESTQSIEFLELEEEKYQEYKEIAKDKEFFSIEHVDLLNLDWNILIILSEKNIGKTHQKYKIIREQIANNKKVLYGRATKADLLQEMQILRVDPASPVILAENKGSFSLYEKIYIENDGKWKRGPEVGTGFYIKEANKVGGSSDWKEYGYVLLDEIVPYDSKKILKLEHLSSWAAFLSSIVRNSNKGLKVVAFGNMLPNNNAFLEFYGINSDDKLRYILRGGKEGAKVLYINVSNLYKSGFSNQKGAARHAPAELAKNLEENFVMNNEINIIPSGIFNKLERFRAFVVRAQKRSSANLYYVIEIRRAFKLDMNKIDCYDVSFYALKMFPLKPYIKIPGVTIYTNERSVANGYRNTKYMATLVGFYHMLKTFQIHNKLLFHDADTSFTITEFLRERYGKRI